MKQAEELKRLFGKRSIYRDESWHSPGGRAIREVVFGFNDGLVSTLGFVVGVAGALGQTRIVLITGLAEMLAGGVSMFFGAYLSTKNQREFFQREIEREQSEIDQMPEREKDEIRRIYSAKGFQGKDLEMVVDHITADRNVWLKCMMEEELGLIFESMDNPLRVGFITGLSFMTGGLIPLLPFALDVLDRPLLHAIFWSAASLFGMGVIKTFLTRKNWFRSGFESFLIGLVTTVIGLAFGKIAAHLIGHPPGF